MKSEEFQRNGSAMSIWPGSGRGYAKHQHTWNSYELTATVHCLSVDENSRKRETIRKKNNATRKNQPKPYVFLYCLHILIDPFIISTKVKKPPRTRCGLRLRNRERNNNKNKLNENVCKN
jgi:hypothetical protein